MLLSNVFRQRDSTYWPIFPTFHFPWEAGKFNQFPFSSGGACGKWMVAAGKRKKTRLCVGGSERSRHRELEAHRREMVEERGDVH